MHTYKDVSLHQTTMTTSKSDLEAKEGQIPNESNFLEFVSLLGSLSTRAAGASTQDDERPECREDVGAAEEGESQQEGPLSASFIGSELKQIFIPKCIHECNVSTGL